MEVGKKKILNGFIGGNNSTQFVIPIYQRNYVWEKKNIVQLMNDIEKMIPFYDNEDESIFHFFGSIVYIDTLHKGSFSEWTVIDGQQRLTTIFLILQALKHIYSENEKIISKKYLLNDEDIINTDDEMDRYRLKPLVSDDNVYKLIQDGKFDKINDKDQNSNVLKAYNVIKKELLNWKEKKHYSFEQIIGAIDKFKVVWIQLDKKEDPQQVFESINSTGVNLTPADLIRNYVLMNKDNDTQTSIYDSYWSPIEFEYVGTKNLKEFFRFYISIKEKNKIPEKEVYERFKQKYEELLKENSETDVLSEILNYAKYYYYISEDASKLPNSEEVEALLKDYRNAKSNMPHIILMETMYLYYKEKSITEDDMKNTIKLLTTYIIRRNIAGLDTKSISNIFGSMLGKVIKKFNKGDNYYNSVMKTFVVETRLTNQYMPTDKNIKDEFIKSNLYSRESTAFVLKKIENNESRIPYSQLNIEHVMPQKDTKYWLNYINKDSVYEEVVNRIGNLTLVDSKDNSSMGNSDFKHKKEILKKSNHIKMNVPILEKDIWNEDEILDRSKKLSESFISLFPYPEYEITTVDDIYSHMNLNNDSISNVDDLKFTKPLEIVINDETNNKISNWNDVLHEVLIYLYNYDSETFMNCALSVNEEFGHQSEQVSYSPDEMRTPYEFVDGVYVEENSNTSHKLILMQRIMNKMNINFEVNITYSQKSSE